LFDFVIVLCSKVKHFRFAVLLTVF